MIYLLIYFYYCMWQKRWHHTGLENIINFYFCVKKQNFIFCLSKFYLLQIFISSSSNIIFIILTEKLEKKRIKYMILFWITDLNTRLSIWTFILPCKSTPVWETVSSVHRVGRVPKLYSSKSKSTYRKFTQVKVQVWVVTWVRAKKYRKKSS